MLNSDCHIEAIAFNVDHAEQWLGFKQIEIAYRLQVNRFRQRESVQLLIEYLQDATIRGSEQNLTINCPTVAT